MGAIEKAVLETMVIGTFVFVLGIVITFAAYAIKKAIRSIIKNRK